MIRKNIILLLLFAGFLGSCVKINVPYSANEVFENKFYMEWNGNPVIPATHNEIPVEFHVHDSVLSVIVKDFHFEMLIRLNHFKGPGTYYFETFSDTTFLTENTAVFKPHEGKLAYSHNDGRSFIRILEYRPEEKNPAISGIFNLYLSGDGITADLEKGYFTWNAVYPY